MKDMAVDLVVDELRRQMARAEKAEARIAEMANILGVPDGARYIADVESRADNIVAIEAERDALKSRVTELEEILRQCDTCPTGGCTTKEPPCR